MTFQSTRQRIVILAFVCFALVANTADARTKVKNICRVKGQEENTIQGIGLVVGLDKSGDGTGSRATVNSLAAAMKFMGTPVPAVDIKDVSNVALVMVRATIPAAGARQGSLLDCTIGCIGGAKSLKGGQLVMTPLLGPRSAGGQVFAFASGNIEIPDQRVATSGKVRLGCRLEEDFFNAFQKDGKITLVLNKNVAGFQVAQDVANYINNQTVSGTSDNLLAVALDQVNIEITIPKHDEDDPVQFLVDILEQTIGEPSTEARVVVNRTAGSIVFTSDVEIGATAVTHSGITLEIGADSPQSPLIAVTPEETASTKLQALINALDAVKVSADDKIDIVLGLNRSGKLYAHLIVE